MPFEMPLWPTVKFVLACIGLVAGGIMVLGCLGAALGGTLQGRISPFGKGKGDWWLSVGLGLIAAGVVCLCVCHLFFSKAKPVEPQPASSPGMTRGGPTAPR